MPTYLIMLIHAFFSFFMTGLIWFVQIVHYPLMARVGVEYFVAYENKHTEWTTWVVMPAMLLELGTGLWLIYAQKGNNGSLWIEMGLLGLIWASTFFIQVPYHNELSQDFNAQTIQKLVQTNWIRTALWSMRSIILLWMLWGIYQKGY